jgi:hypothetical protein
MNGNAPIDPRWDWLQGRAWKCPSCEETHDGLFDLAFSGPALWPQSEDKSPNDELDMSADFLSEDFCVLNGQYFFVRCVLQLPVLNTGGSFFGFGVWSTLSEKNFNLYVDSFDSGEQSHLGPWFGWLSNRLLGYPDTLNLKCQAYPKDGRKRPLLGLELTDHPLAREQSTGITLDRLLDIYSAHGHDIRATLRN